MMNGKGAGTEIMSPRLDEPTLVARAQGGDAEAFGELVRRYKAAVHGYLLGRVRDFAWAEDLAQETFVAAFLGLGRLRDRSRFGPWLFGIAENISALWLRRMERARRVIVRAAEADEFVAPSQPSEEPDDDEKVLRALEHIGPTGAAAVTLYYGDRLPQRECAAFLGISHKAFESRLIRARRQMKKEIIAMTEDSLRRHAPGEEFDEAVADEIRQLVAVVGGHYRKQPVEAAEERLRVLFARNEDRLADLIRDAATPEERHAAARMVLALGPTAIGRALALALSEDDRVRRNALAAVPTATVGVEMADTHVYLVLDAIHGAVFSDAQKADILVGLIRRPILLADLVERMDLKRYAADAPIYMEMLLRYGETAIARLVEAARETALRTPSGGETPEPQLAMTLALFGTAGAEAVLASLCLSRFPCRCDPLRRPRDRKTPMPQFASARRCPRMAFDGLLVRNSPAWANPQEFISFHCPDCSGYARASEQSTLRTSAYLQKKAYEYCGRESPSAGTSTASSAYMNLRK